MAIRTFYVAIDMHLQTRGSALIMLSDLLKGLQHQINLENLVSYGLWELQVKAMQVEGKECTEQDQRLTMDLRAMKMGM